MSGIAAAVTAAAAVAGATVAGVSAVQQAAGQKKALGQQRAAQEQAANLARAQQRASEEAQAMANKRTPDVGGILQAATKEGGGSGAGTMLTGPTGANFAGQALGKTSLLGG